VAGVTKRNETKREERKKIFSGSRPSSSNGRRLGDGVHPGLRGCVCVLGCATRGGLRSEGVFGGERCR
jgi:hypothetical protein